MNLSSMLLVAPSNGNTIDDHGYYAYGRDRRGSELHTAQHFTGQLTDGTGLIYMNARYYDPQLGQFISPDTLVPDATSLMDFNRYAYARGNPMKYNDPSGHNGISIEGQCECGGGLLPGEVASRQAAQAGLNVELTGPEEVSLINAQEAPVAPEAPAPSTPLKNAVSANDGAVAPDAPPAADVGESGTAGESTVASVQSIGSGRAYSVLYETNLPNDAYPGRSRGYHNQVANQSLLNTMNSDPAFSSKIEETIPNIRGQLQGSNGGISRQSPDGWTWHHTPDEGVMQLVPRTQHTAPGPLQELFHPDGVGGYKLWGTIRKPE